MLTPLEYDVCFKSNLTFTALQQSYITSISNMNININLHILKSNMQQKCPGYIAIFQVKSQKKLRYFSSHRFLVHHILTQIIYIINEYMRVYIYNNNNNLKMIFHTSLLESEHSDMQTDWTGPNLNSWKHEEKRNTPPVILHSLKL